MRAQQERGRRRICIAGGSSNQIRKVHFAPRRIIGECLTCYMPAGMPKLLLDVIPGLFNRVRASGVRTQIDEPLNMSQSFLAREFLPDLRLLRRTGAFPARDKEDEQE